MTNYGKTIWLTVNEIIENSDSILRKFNNLNGYPLKVSIFRRYPTCIISDDLPKSFLNSYISNEMTNANGYSGFDGLVLGNLAKYLNFTAITKIPEKNLEFGYKLENGTFVGKY